MDGHPAHGPPRPAHRLARAHRLAGGDGRLVRAIAEGVNGLYPDAADRRVYEATLGASPISEAINGRGYDLDVLGGITAYEVGLFGLLLLPVIAAHLAIRHTRTQEDFGRAEVVTRRGWGAQLRCLPRRSW